MDKSTEKKKYGIKYKRDILLTLAKKYNVTTQHVRDSIRGHRNSLTSLSICDDYKIMEKAYNQVIKQLQTI